MNASANNPQLDNTRIYLLTGAREGEEMTEGFVEMEKILKIRGKRHLWQAKLDDEGNHSETFWRREFPYAIDWLFDAGCQQ
ncbi:hypothetical protein [Microbulbifer sp.]|uniref:hypothetical protein n=1 Tax=Microbulbifer sp. TaxID=1908541 RepID=UPI002F949258